MPAVVENTQQNVRMSDRVAVMGAGGVGAAIAAYLIREGHDVTLIDQWAAHVDAIRTKGLSVSELRGEFTVTPKAYHLHEICNTREKFDIVYVALKSYDTRWATCLIEPFLSRTGFILPVQNSLNDETVASIVGFTRTVGCVPDISAGVYEPGHLVRTDPPSLAHRFIVGELNGLVTPRVRRVVSALSALGPTEATTNIWGVRWAKLTVNCMMNALSAIVGPSSSDLNRDEQEILNLVRVASGGEVVRIGTTLGVAIEPIFGIPSAEFANANSQVRMLEVKTKLEDAMSHRYTSGEEMKRLGVPHRASLLQDMMKGRRTEIDFLNGLVTNKGEEIGIPTPVNRTIWSLTREIEEGRTEPGPASLKLLRSCLASQLRV